MSTALIIDDDKATRKLIRRVLEKVQFKVDEAEDGTARSIKSIPSICRKRDLLIEFRALYYVHSIL